MAGIETLLPALAAVILAFALKRTVIALFAAVWIGGMVASGWQPLRGMEQAFAWMTGVITDDWNARFLLLISLLGSGAALMHCIGGSAAVATALAKRIKSAKQVQGITYLLGLIIFFNDYINTVIVGNATRNIAAKYRVSTEKLAYILDSTAAPVATIAPISDWIGYQVALIAAALVALQIVDVSPYALFLHSIPWNFYCLLTLAAVPTVIFSGRDFGPMRRAEVRAAIHHQLVAAGDVPLSDVEHDLGAPHKPDEARLRHFVIPIVALVAGTVWGVWHAAGPVADPTLGSILAATDVSVALLAGAIAMTLTGLILALARGVRLGECERTILAGFSTMLPALVIMILAWSVAAACDALGTAEYITKLTSSWMTPTLLPVVVFLAAAGISFSTGTSWGTMAILTPIALPVALGISPGTTDLTAMHIAVGATFSGAVFGDHCSPISDTTVMSSIFAGADHIAHVRTQIPYALVPAGLSSLLYVSSSFVTNPFVLLLSGIALQFVVFRILGKSLSSTIVDSPSMAPPARNADETHT